MKLVRLYAFAALALGTMAAYAQALNDPMRPPQFSVTASAPEAGPVLQSVIISKERRYAIISGERIAVGGVYGEAKLVRIAENEVTLRDAAGETVLKLVPEIKKQIVAPKTVSHDALSGRKTKQ
ncbi:MAG TPA: hypothetical protein VKZ48_00805 [Burkholderiales bacterium]|nr:hypothetical protein [Burkholderiales bacterium]